MIYIYITCNFRKQSITSVIMYVCSCVCVCVCICVCVCMCVCRPLCEGVQAGVFIAFVGKDTPELYKTQRGVCSAISEICVILEKSMLIFSHY